MIKFSGRIDRSTYWKAIVFLLVGLILLSSLLLILLDIQNAELSGASAFNQILAVVFLILLIMVGLFFSVAFIGTVIRRAHDTNNSMLWIFLGLFIPLGFVILGLVPSRK